MGRKKEKSNTSRSISRFVRRQPPRQFSYIQISGHPLLRRHCAEECLVAGKPVVHDECGHRQQDGAYHEDPDHGRSDDFVVLLIHGEEVHSEEGLVTSVK